MNELARNKCVLTLDNLVFDKIVFQRKGFKNKNKLCFRFGFGFEEQEERGFAVHLSVFGKKEQEYEFEIVASGYFTLDPGEDPMQIIKQNAVAIIFPYIRSQISLLTAQPEMTPVVLPPVNIVQLLEDAVNEDN